MHTQLPYDYYSLKYCRPIEGIKPYAENLGEFLSGDRIENSPYDINMLQEEYCKVLCQVTLTSKTVNDFKTAIKEMQLALTDREITGLFKAIDEDDR